MAISYLEKFGVRKIHNRCVTPAKKSRKEIAQTIGVSQSGVTATIYREIFMSIRGDAKSNQTEQDTQKTTQKTTRKTTQKTTQKILDLIVLNPYITRNEMAIECAVTPDAIKLQLKI